MTSNPDIGPMGDAYTQHEARNWHENAKEWQAYAERQEDAVAAEQLLAANRLAALHRIEILAQNYAAEPWAMTAILEVLRATLASPTSAPPRWEDALASAVRITREDAPRS